MVDTVQDKAEGRGQEGKCLCPPPSPPVAVIKTPGRRQLKWQQASGSQFKAQPIKAGMSGQQETEVAGHMTPTIRK